MKDLLSGLQASVQNRFPAMAASLRPGASEAQLDAFEAHIGQRLPAQFRELYRWHDGQDDDDGTALGLFVGLPFLPLAQAQRHWQDECRALDVPAAQQARDGQAYGCVPPGAIKPVPASRCWIPFADDGAGAFLGVDLDPGPAGQPGQVITHGGREFVRVGAAPSLSVFLADLLALYENQRYELIEQDDGEVSLGTLAPRTDHFMDYLRKVALARP